MSPTSDRAPDLRSYLAVLWRRRWLVLIVAVTVPVVAYVLAGRATPIYESTSEVLLSRSAQGVAEINDPTFWNPQRAAETQVRLARVPAVAELTLEAAGIEGRSPGGFLGSSSVVAEDTSDILTFSVRDPDPETAERLATEYARQYINFRNDLETSELKEARRAVESRLRELERNGQTDSPLYASLVEKQQQLLTAEAVVASTAKLVRPADGAGQVEPRPMRAGMLGLVVGLALCVGLAFFVDALDSRVRTAEEIADLLGLPLLAQVPPASASARRLGKVTMMSDPDGHEAETYRMLRTNLDFANLDREARAIMITSALEQEGKSTTISNLAIAYARTGRRVVVVDLDLRRPTLDHFFGLPSRPGVTEVVLGDVALEAALQRVSLDHRPAGTGGSRPRVLPPEAGRKVRGEANGGRVASTGSLEVLVAGAIPPNPGEFITSRLLDTLLEDLRDRSDLLLVDGPPMLLAGDTMSLSAKVDSIIVAARAETFRRPTAVELTRMLNTVPAAKLGLVVTGSKSAASRGYYYSSQPRKRERVA